jgi:HrpA-like RNA helicase
MFILAVLGDPNQFSYVTDGLLLAEASHDRRFSEYHTVVIDEAHECNFNIYLLLAAVRRASKDRRAAKGGRPLKVIVMSTTIAVDKFVKFLGKAGEVKVIDIPGEPHAVKVFYSRATLRSNEDRDEPHASDLVEESCKAVRMIVNKPPGDIIIFLPGAFEVQDACRLLAETVPEVRAVPFTAAEAAYSRTAIFGAAPGDNRRTCVVATNVAETSLTLPNAVYVIDTGLRRVKRFNPRLDAEDLTLCAISKASARQRAGRVGRTGPGEVYRVYTPNDYIGLREAPIPEVQIGDVTPLLLQALDLGFEAMELPLVDQPATESLLHATEVLLDL